MLFPNQKEISLSSSHVPYNNFLHLTHNYPKPSAPLRAVECSKALGSLIQV